MRAEAAEPKALARKALARELSSLVVVSSAEDSAHLGALVSFIFSRIHLVFFSQSKRPLQFYSPRAPRANRSTQQRGAQAATRTPGRLLPALAI